MNARRLPFNGLDNVTGDAALGQRLYEDVCGSLSGYALDLYRWLCTRALDVGSDTILVTGREMRDACGRRNYPSKPLSKVQYREAIRILSGPGGGCDRPYRIRITAWVHISAHLVRSVRRAPPRDLLTVHLEGGSVTWVSGPGEGRVTLVVESRTEAGVERVKLTMDAATALTVRRNGAQIVEVSDGR